MVDKATADPTTTQADASGKWSTYVAYVSERPMIRVTAEAPQHRPNTDVVAQPEYPDAPDEPTQSATKKATPAPKKPKAKKKPKRPARATASPCRTSDPDAAINLRASRVTDIALVGMDYSRSIDLGSMTYIATPLTDSPGLALVAAYPLGAPEKMVAVNGLARGQTDLPRGGGQRGLDAVLACLD